MALFLSVITVAGAALPRDALAAKYCLENGGDYAGCVAPLGFRWESNDGTIHLSIQKF